MNKGDCLKILTEDIHSAAVATVAGDGHPQTRIIDMMLWDECGVYFLTAEERRFTPSLWSSSISLFPLQGRKSEYPSGEE